MALLTLRNVSHAYRSKSLGSFGKIEETAALEMADLTLERGEIFGLVGESGCGKTTLSRCILGLVDYTGEIALDGVILPPRKRSLDFNRRVQAVFQDPAASLNPVKTIGWLLEEPLKAHGVRNKTERAARADELLLMVGLDPSYKTRRMGELSGGQRQRVCIACALALKPELIIADEAVSALDVSVGAQILNLFRELHAKLDLSLLFISHDLNLVYYLCDRIAVMRRGQILETGRAEDIYQHPGHPYTEDLLSAMETQGGESEKPVREPLLEATVPHITKSRPCVYGEKCSRKTRGCESRVQAMRNIAPPGEEPHFARCENFIQP